MIVAVPYVLAVGTLVLSIGVVRLALGIPRLGRWMGTRVSRVSLQTGRRFGRDDRDGA